MLKVTSVSLACLIFFYVNGYAISYKNETRVCAELKILDKVSKNCEGSAEFKETNGKYSLVVKFKVADFETEDSSHKKPAVSEKKELVFISPAFSDLEWRDRLKGAFNLVTADLQIQDGKVELTNTVLLKKHVNSEVIYQVDSIIPMNKASFLKVPKEVKGAKTFHLTLIVPASEIKSVVF